MESSSRKFSRSFNGMAGAAVLLCSFGLVPQQAGATVTLSPQCAGADFGTACSLAELLAGGSILINETLFSNFAFNRFSASLVDPALIRVDTNSAQYNPGLTFVSTGGTLGVSGGDLSFSDLGFDVGIVSGTLRIKDNSLGVTGSVTGNGSSFDVFEALTGAVSNVLDVLCDGAATPNCSPSTLTDAGVFVSPVTALSVLAGIDLIADAGAAGAAQISSITMNFSEVPTPGSLALLGLGLIGMRVTSRRRGRIAAC